MILDLLDNLRHIHANTAIQLPQSHIFQEWALMHLILTASFAPPGLLQLPTSGNMLGQQTNS